LIDDDRDRICEDGESVRIPMHLCDAVLQRRIAGLMFDAANHQPDYRDRVSESKSTKLADLDAARDAVRTARSAWIEKMCDAWRTPPTRPSRTATRRLRNCAVRAPPPSESEN
jgi:hypothetical protein